MLNQELVIRDNILTLPGNARQNIAKSLPDPEVIEKPMRRQFSLEYKLRILKEADSLLPGEISALLRREGIYWSTFSRWRREREAGLELKLKPKKRGKKQNPDHPWANKVNQLEREKAQLQRKLQKAEKIIEVQKKISELMSLHQDQEIPGGVH